MIYLFVLLHGTVLYLFFMFHFLFSHINFIHGFTGYLLTLLKKMTFISTVIRGTVNPKVTITVQAWPRYFGNWLISQIWKYIKNKCSIYFHLNSRNT